MIDTDAADRLADLAARYWRFWCYESPLTAVLAGEPTPDTVLFRESPADHDRRGVTARSLLAELGAIDPGVLGPRDRATHRLLHHELEGIRSLHEVGAHRRPSLFPTGPSMLVSFFANSTSVEDAEAAERYVERLASVPAYLGGLRESLQAGHDEGFRYPRVVLERASGTTRAAIAGPVETLPWMAPFSRSPAAGSGALLVHAERAAALIRHDVVPAFEAFAGFLEGQLADGARETVACTDAPAGREHYRALLRDFTTTDLEPEAIHELGLAEVARLETEIASAAAEAGFAGDLAAYRKHLSGGSFVAASKEALREHVESLCKRIDGKVPFYFARVPRITYGVELMPEAVAERMPPAYAQPNPADRSAPGIFWITSLPDRCPTYTHLPVALHEAWPGHLMHIALMQEADDLPSFRRHGAVRYPVCIEGWAIYCEGLGVDMGLYETPHQHYGRLEMEIWRALRLVVDTGMHWLGWSRERAVDTLASRMAMPRLTIEAEVDRYISWPGQALVYQIGHLEFRRLQRRSMAQLGDRFSYRAFHEVLLGAGPVSLPVLREVVDGWLDRQVRRTESGSSHANA